MLDKTQYEEQILNEIRAMPEESLPSVVRLLAVIREEFTARHAGSEPSEDDSISHERTRRLLSGSEGNWAQDVIADREDRV